MTFGSAIIRTENFLIDPELGSCINNHMTMTVTMNERAVGVATVGQAARNRGI